MQITKTYLLLGLACGVAMGVAAAAPFKAYVPQANERVVDLALTTRTVVAEHDRRFVGASWLWHPGARGANAKVWFKSVLQLPAAVKGGRLVFSCDNGAEVFVNGRSVAKQPCNGWSWNKLTEVEIGTAAGRGLPALPDRAAAAGRGLPALPDRAAAAGRGLPALPDTGFKVGANEIVVAGENAGAAAGLLLSLELQLADGTTRRLVSDETHWDCSTNGKNTWLKPWPVRAYGDAPWGAFDKDGKCKAPFAQQVFTEGRFQWNAAGRGLPALPDRAVAAGRGLPALPDRAAAAGRGLPALPSDVKLGRAARPLAAAKVYLVCDEVAGKQSAEIVVNGKKSGTLVEPPHRLDITELVKDGENVLTTSPHRLRNARIVVADAQERVPPDRGGVPPPPASASSKVFGLTCEYEAEPLGVVKPRFFWKYTGEGTPKFRFTLATAPEQLGAGDVCAFETSQHLYVEPKVELKPFTRYWWRVEKDGEHCDASFVTGVAKWTKPFFGPTWKRYSTEYWRTAKKVVLDHPKSAVIAVAMTGNYRLYVNGQEVEKLIGPNRSNIERGYVLAQTYDIGKLVKNGENEIELLVSDGMGKDMRGVVSCVSIDGHAETATGTVAIDSAQPWRVLKTAERLNSSTRHYGSYGEHLFDVRKVTEMGMGQVVPSDNLKVACDTAPRDQVVRLIRPVSIESDGEGYRIDMGEAFFGYLRLKLKGKPGEVALLGVSDQPDARIGFNQHWEYEFAGGDGVFENKLNWMAGRYVYLTGAARPGFDDVTGVMITGGGRRTGWFRGDADLEQIQRLDNDTYLATTFSGVTVDCPHRERMGYGEAGYSTCWGDGLPYFDTASYYYASLLKWGSTQDANGYIPHTAPNGRSGGGTFWSCYPINVLDDYVRRYPDARLVDAMRPVVEKWLDYLHAQVEDGLLRRYEDGYWMWLGDWAYPDGNVHDWGKSREALHFNNCTYAWAIKRALDVPGLITDATRRAELTRRHAELVKNIEKEFFKDGIYCAPHARYQAIAIVAGVPAAAGHEAESEKQMLDIVERKGYIDGGSPGYTTICRVLCRSPRGRELALQALRRRTFPGYLYFSDQGYNTLPEYFTFGFHDHGSMIHTCFTGAAGVLVNGFAGIEVKGDEIAVTPFISKSLPSYEAQIETLYGPVCVKVERKDDGKTGIEVWLPYGCRGKLCVGGGEKSLRPGNNVMVEKVQ